MMGLRDLRGVLLSGGVSSPNLRLLDLILKDFEITSFNLLLAELRARHSIGLCEQRFHVRLHDDRLHIISI